MVFLLNLYTGLPSSTNILRITNCHQNESESLVVEEGGEATSPIGLAVWSVSLVVEEGGEATSPIGLAVWSVSLVVEEEGEATSPIGIAVWSVFTTQIWPS